MQEEQEEKKVFVTIRFAGQIILLPIPFEDVTSAEIAINRWKQDNRALFVDHSTFGTHEKSLPKERKEQ